MCLLCMCVGKLPLVHRTQVFPPANTLLDTDMKFFSCLTGNKNTSYRLTITKIPFTD